MMKVFWAPILPGEPACERHGDRLGHRVGGDDPSSLRRRHAEVAGNRRDRHVGDRRVEHDEEVAESDQDGGDVKAHSGQRTGLQLRLQAALRPWRSWRLPLWRSVGDVHVDFHRQADAKRVLLKLLRIERDPHRQALHHLDPVAGRILRRNESESGARAA